MSKKTLFLFTLATFFLFTFSGGAMGALVPGDYTLSDTEISNGSWTESFNVFNAHSTDLDNYWTITAHITEDAVPFNYVDDYGVTYNFYTEYNVDFSFITPGAWGDEITLFSAAGEMYSALGDDVLKFYFATGGTVEGVPVTLEMWFDSNDLLSSYTIAGPVHFGSNFKNIKLHIAPIPAAAWLLGTGLIGLVVLKRRRQSGPI